MAEGAPGAFFSYCREDSDFALRLAGDLKAAGASVWLDQLDILPGQRWDRAVEDALGNCPRMLVILSPTSVNSTNVMDEVSFALEEKKEVIPIIHKDCTVPFRLRRVQYVDFRHDYARGLKELLKTLGPDQKAAPSVPASSAAPSLGDAIDVKEIYERESTPEGQRRKAVKEAKQAERALVGQERELVAEKGMVTSDRSLRPLAARKIYITVALAAILLLVLSVATKSDAAIGVVGGSFAVLFITFLFRMLLDWRKRRFESKRVRVIWLLVLVFFPIWGAVVYWSLVVRLARTRSTQST